MPGRWSDPFTERINMAPFYALERQFNLSSLSQWPQANGLNRLAKKHKKNVPSFRCQSQVNFDEGYYEQIIYEQGIIPTRSDNWHDLFNGLIWLQFPQTKALLNRLHVQDITAHGLSPRTPRRNRITHFDECGVILVSEGREIPDMLASHLWSEAFVKNRNAWGSKVTAYIFGHANLEMLLNPFIGLTGKWLHLEANDAFFSMADEEKLDWIDKSLVVSIESGNVFNVPRTLKPIPLLGVPGWWDANSDPTFYENTDYFRPLRKSR